MGIRDCKKLRRDLADSLHAQALVAKVFSGEHIYLGERLVVAHELEGLAGRERAPDLSGEVVWIDRASHLN